MFETGVDLAEKLLLNYFDQKSVGQMVFAQKL